MPVKMRAESEDKMEINEKQLVSIIIPVYNVDEYLQESLESVLAQTYPNWEALLVDDGATDQSGKICDAFSAKDKRFKVFHLENKGAAAARNFALDRISGDYVVFIDADDYVKPDFIEKMLQAAIDTNVQLVVCDWMYGPRHSPEDFWRHKTTDTPAKRLIDLNQYAWTGKYSHLFVWAAMYSATLARSFSFSVDLFVGEDTLYFASVLKKAGTFLYVDEQYYYYRFRSDSTVHSQYQLKHATELTSWERLIELYADQSDSFMNECEGAAAMRYKKHYLQASASRHINKDLLRVFYKKAWNRYSNVLRSPEINLRRKCFYSAFLLMPRTYAMFWNQFDRWKKSKHRSGKKQSGFHGADQADHG